MKTHTFAKKTGAITLSEAFLKRLSSCSTFAVSGTLSYLKTALFNMTGKDCFIVNLPEIDESFQKQNDNLDTIKLRKWIIDGLMIQPSQDLESVLNTLEVMDIALAARSLLSGCDTLILETPNGQNISMTSPKELIDNGLKIVERNPNPNTPPIEEDCCLCCVDIEKTIEANGLKLLSKTSIYETYHSTKTVN